MFFIFMAIIAALQVVFAFIVVTPLTQSAVKHLPFHTAAKYVALWCFNAFILGPWSTLELGISWWGLLGVAASMIISVISSKMITPEMSETSTQLLDEKVKPIIYKIFG